MSNATYLFEGKSGSSVWPPSAESFWTSVFALFVLQLGAKGGSGGRLTIWHCTNRGAQPWYAPRPANPALELRNVHFDSIAVEPNGITKAWPGTDLMLSARDGGFSPDVLIRSRDAGGHDHFVVVENKVTHEACLADNQVENYPRLAAWLIGNKISFDVFFLQSVGCCDALYQQAGAFQATSWGNHFGILLWEEVLQQMSATGFAPIGLPVRAWQQYVTALTSECGGAA